MKEKNKKKWQYIILFIIIFLIIVILCFMNFRDKEIEENSENVTENIPEKKRKSGHLESY